VAQLVLVDKYTMQIKHYTILDSADMSAIQAWAADPNNHCIIILQGRVGAVTRSLCVNQPKGMRDVITPTENHLSGMIVETTWPE
jgi:hypothetical protein